MLEMNPVGLYPYLILLIIEALYQVVIPFGLIANIPQISSDLTSRSTFNSTDYYLVILVVSVAMTLLVISFFLFMWIKTHYYIVGRLAQRKEIIDASLNSHLQFKYLSKALMLIVMIHYKLIKFPSLLVYFAYIQGFFEKDAAINQAEYQALRVISLLFVIVDMLLQIVIEKFLSSPYPTKNIPWAKSASSFSLLFNFQLYFTALTFSFPISSVTIKPLIIMCFLYSIVVLVGTIVSLRSYSIIIVRMTLLSCSFLSMSFFMTIFESFLPTTDLNSDMEAISFALTSLALFLASLFLQQQVTTVLVTKTKFQQPQDTVDSIARMLIITQVSNEASETQIVAKTQLLRSLFFNHCESCSNMDCLCKNREASKLFYVFRVGQQMFEMAKTRSQSSMNNNNINSSNPNSNLNGSNNINYIEALFDNYKRLLLMLIEVMVEGYKYEKQVQMQQSEKAFQLLDFFKIRYRFLLHNMLYSNYYNLLQVHDCNNRQTCTLYNCFLAYQLKTSLIKGIKKDELVARNNINLQKNIVYEELFQQFLEETKACNKTASVYWKTLLSEDSQNNIELIIQSGSSLTHQYQKFQDMYDIISSEIGSTLVIECLAFKVHKSILNFEGESDENINHIRNLEIRDKYLYQSNSGSQGSNQNYMLSKVDGNYSLVVMSISPTSFQNIKCVNKQFIIISGFSEIDLGVNSKATLFMPKGIEEIHGDIIKNCLAQNSITTQTKDIKTWIKHKTGTISPIRITLHPTVSLTKGIDLVGVLIQPSFQQLFGQNIPISSIFYILTDRHDKIIHFSMNCINILKFQLGILSNYVFISELFPELLVFDQSQIYEGIETYLDINCPHLQFLELLQDKGKSYIFSKVQQKTQKPSQESQVKVKIARIDHNFISDRKLSEYMFVITSTNNLTINSNSTFSLAPKNNTIQHHKSQIEGGGGQHDYSLDSNNDMGVVIFEGGQNFLENTGSMTSASSSTRTNQSLREMKGVLNLRQLPRTLSRFKLNLLAFFGVLISTSIAMLIVNFVSKVSFVSDVAFCENVMNVRNQVESSKLQIIYIYTMANSKHTNFHQLNSIKIAENDPLTFFLNNLNESISTLQSSLDNITLALQGKEGVLIDLFSNETIELIELTTKGTQYLQLSSLVDSMQQYLVNSDAILNTPNTSIDIGKNVFGVSINQLNGTTVSEVQQSFFFIIENALSDLRDKLNSVDTTFIDIVYQHAQQIEYSILIIAIVCSVIVLVTSTIILPFLFQLDLQLLKMVEMTINIKKDSKIKMLRRVKKFDNYLEENKYLTSFLELVHDNMQDDDLDIEDIKITSQAIHNKREGEEEEQKKGDQYFNNPSKVKTFSQSQQHKKDMKRKMRANKQQLKKQGSYINGKKAIQEEDNEDDDQEDQSESNQGGEVGPSLDKIFEQNKTGKGTYNSSYGKSGNDSGAQEKEGEREIQRINNNYSLKHKSMVDKTKKSILIYLFALTICSFYVGSYFYSNMLFDGFSSSFQDINVFYNRIPTVANAFFVMQKEYLIQQEIISTTADGGGNAVSTALDECMQNEIDYQQVLTNNGGVLSNIKSQLNLIDTNQLCGYLMDNNITDETCNSTLNGFYNLGLTQIIAAYMKNINQRNIELNDQLLTQTKPMTHKQIESAFFDSQTFNFVMSFYKVVESTLSLFQSLCSEQLYDRIDIMYKYLILIFVAFILILLILLVLTLQVLIRQLKKQMIQTQIQLKLIPGNEYLRLKEALTKDNLMQMKMLNKQ